MASNPIINIDDDTYLKQSVQVMKSLWYIPSLRKWIYEQNQWFIWKVNDRSFHRLPWSGPATPGTFQGASLER
jgi:hypothetical protein